MRVPEVAYTSLRFTHFAATLGWIHVPAPPVEAVIALSIVFVAGEIVDAQKGRRGLKLFPPSWLWRVPPYAIGGMASFLGRATCSRVLRGLATSQEALGQ